MSRRPILTAEHLQEAGACPEQVALFLQTFPEGAALTVANIARARAAGLNVGWCEVMLDKLAEAEYDRAAASVWAEYNRAIEPAQAEYHLALASASASAQAEYLRAIAPARAKFIRASDRALLAGLVATFNRRQQEGGAA